MGPVPADELGTTLTHEHLICDWTKPLCEPQGAVDRSAFVRRVDPSICWLLTEDPSCCLDNARLEDTAAVVDELQWFIDAGGQTVVDCTNGDIGRNPRALREISERTGLNIVMGSGWYVHPYHDSGTALATADELYAQILAEFADGVGDTGVKPGVIGEIGVSPEFTVAERVRLRAAARAQLALGVPLLIHLPGWQRRAFEVLDIVLSEEGVAPEAVVLCHMDPSGEDVVYQREVADRGVWLEFDMIGMSNYFPGEGQSPSPDQTATAIARLVEAGHASRLLLSHDLSLKNMWTRNGGNGVGYVPRLFLPRLERHGVPASVTADLLTTNPRRLFIGAARASAPGESRRGCHGWELRRPRSDEEFA
ncbi:MULTISPECIES: phosphotriesterase family protein [Amycolatopsis methanolica group]|nr:phosphotriesterase [Amycolatopsis methanolica]